LRWHSLRYAQHCTVKMRLDCAQRAQTSTKPSNLN